MPNVFHYHLIQQDIQVCYIKHITNVMNTIRKHRNIKVMDAPVSVASWPYGCFVYRTNSKIVKIKLLTVQSVHCHV